MWLEVVGGWSGFELLGAPFWAVVGVVFADEVYGSGEVGAVDDDFDEVAFTDASDGSTCQCFGSDMSDAGAGGDTGKTGIGDECDVFAVGKVFECGGDLVELLHASA